jgi:hypothetical protein
MLKAMTGTLSAINPWLALEAGADPAERHGTLRRAHEAFVRSGAAGPALRGIVTESWRRSARAGVDPDAPAAPIDLADADLDEYRSAHALAPVMPVLREVLAGVHEAGDQMLAVTDAGGRLLWVEGQPGVLRRAERMNFVAGACWDEPHIGTNAPGTALAVDHAVQIFASEHFSRAVQPWTCSAAPIHDPATGRLLGAVDVTGGDQVANPHSLALVQAAARLAETLLAEQAPRVAGSIGFSGLGRDEAVLSGRGGRVVLSRRHSEIVALLACHPEGLTGDQLGLALYGDDLNPVTLRAEMSRLRVVLGPELLASRPYRLQVPVDADFLAVTRMLAAGALREVLAAYRGPLLPASEAPGVARRRLRLENEVRAGVLAAGDLFLLDAWARGPSGHDDLVVWEALARLSPVNSTRQATAAARVMELRLEYGLLPDATSLQR